MRNNNKRLAAPIAAALAIFVSVLVLCAVPSAGADDQATGVPISNWRRASGQDRSNIIDLLSADMLADLMEKSSKRDAYPAIMYYVQFRTNMMLDFAIRHGFTAFAKKLVELYLQPLSFLDSKKEYLFYEGNNVSKPLPAEAHLWLRPNGEEHVLSSSQFLYLVAHSMRIILTLPAGERPARSEELIERYAPLLVEHYRRWVLADEGIFQVRGWGCADGLFNHRDFLRAQRERKFGRPMLNPSKPTLSYCDALTDTDLWILAGVTEMLMAHRLDPRRVPLTADETTGYRDYLALGNALVTDRLAKTDLADFDRKPTTGYDFDPGEWRDYPENRYSGYTGNIFPEDNSAFPTINPDFEEAPRHGKIPGWTMNRGITGELSTGGDAFNGMNALRATAVSAGAGASICQDIGVIPQQTFRAFGHVRLAGDASATLRVTFFDKDRVLLGSQRTKAVADASAPNAWQRLQIDGSVPGDAAHVTLAMEVSGSAPILIDAVRFVQSQSPDGRTLPITIVAPPPGVTGAWDLSHARRFVNVFQTLLDGREFAGSSGPDESILAGLARQLAYAVFNGDFERPRFNNYWDGTDGWYRVNYVDRTGFGYAPSAFTESFFTGGFCALSSYDAGLARVCQRVWDIAAKNGPEPLLSNCRVEMFLGQDCPGAKEALLQFLAAFDP